MVSPVPAPNLSLQGHVVLVIAPWELKTTYLDRLQRKHPKLKIVLHHVESLYNAELPKDLRLDVWKDVTVLLSARRFPSIEMAPKLQYVQLTSAGCNQIINNPLFTNTDIAFCTANGVHPPQIAEWVFATFLAFQHHIPFYLDAMRDGNWLASDTDEDVEDAVGLRMGILGYGCIGRQCARIGKAMGMEIHAYTLHERATPDARRDESYTEPGMGDPEGILPTNWFYGSTKEATNQFLESDLDLLVISMPLTTITQNMIAAPQFDIMSRKKTFLCNVGRGAIVNTEDLIVALNQGQIRGAALDVTDPEPLPKDHPLWSTKNTIITPHTSGNSRKYNDRVLAIMEYNLQRISEGKAVVNRVDKELGY